MTEAAQKAADGPGAEDWAGEMGARWLANLAAFEGTVAPIGVALLRQAALAPGERVLDLGCGGGATSLAAARAVAPGGEVLGLDISPELVAEAGRRAEAEGLEKLRFHCGDAAVADVPGAPWDRLISRFGSMFFEAPKEAFDHLRRQLKPGGRIDLAVWGPPPQNPWMFETLAIIRAHVELPPPVPRAPGPFAFEDRDWLAEVLHDAGFGAAQIVPATGLLPAGGPGASPEQAQHFVMNGMSFGRVLAEQDEALQEEVRRKLVALYARHHRAGEGVMMGYTAWLVTGRA